MQGTGCKVQGAEYRVHGVWFGVYPNLHHLGGVGFKSVGDRVWDVGCRVQGAGCRVQGVKCRV